MTANRQKLLAQLHIAKKDMALADESYRALLHRVTGKSSAREMSDAQIGRVLAEFSALGWKKGRFKKYAASAHPDVRKVFALWGSLKDHLDCKGSRAGLRRFVENMVGVSDPNFLDGKQTQQVIEALKAMQRRYGVG
ncbi:MULTISPECIES: gp16 family protein [unclassified Saccharibacter]|uniref:gp16 family protein n=1 Tax=unclassified Saccharibacter TaxID=2648722 RepID=UPI001327EE31|nr:MULTISPECIES: regulatory protein GemA [unclassified Saccharibacter]MXV35811.1 DUF1018 domain-containing protein [Saccharibacter sp. EH611]MXV57932.1 DUF1018 domain-containing protein [Saccharibacter sp. EH70]MXV66327.1 DUF1018 domain-containing protein [Saccharibacter sp. EH60]